MQHTANICSGITVELAQTLHWTSICYKQHILQLFPCNRKQLNVKSTVGVQWKTRHSGKLYILHWKYLQCSYYGAKILYCREGGESWNLGSGGEGSSNLVFQINIQFLLNALILGYSKPLGYPVFGSRKTSVLSWSRIYVVNEICEKYTHLKSLSKISIKSA